MISDITAVVLLGGQSARMGSNKASLPWKSSTILGELLQTLHQQFEHIQLIANEPELFRGFGYPIINDLFPGFGPLAGIHAGLVHAPTKKCFIISCDLPLVSRELITFIITNHGQLPITICSAEGFLHHLCGIYEKTIIGKLESLLSAMKTQAQLVKQKSSLGKVRSFLQSTEHLTLYPESQPFYSPSLFFNVNTPEDYQKLLVQFP